MNSTRVIMMRNKDFVVFILTHGRPRSVLTLKALERSGYTGEVRIVIDDEDKKADVYRELYGDRVMMFSKKEIARTFDEGDNFNDRRAIIYARNACFERAKELGFTYFMELDDDYDKFAYKFDSELNFKESMIRNLDAVLDAMIDFYKTIPAKAIAMAQNGDFIGGGSGSFARDIKLRRKCMNTFICSVERPFQFIGRINEDVNTYTRMGNVGDVFFTVPNVAINQKQTQANKGGMTDLYLDAGTYVKSFYSVMYLPSGVKIAEMGDKHKRIHHRVSWNNAVPQIVDQKYKKR